MIAVNNNQRRWAVRWLLALLLCIAVVQQAAAVIVYESPVNRLIFSGRVSAFSTWQQGVSGDDHDPTNAGTRARLILDHNFGHGWAGVARTEWGFNPFFEGGKFNAFKRQNYVGLTHRRYGTLLYGKQYSIWYSMVGVWTDYFWINGTAAQGSFSGRRADGGFEGNGRPDRALSYRTDLGDWSIGLMYQLGRERLGQTTIRSVDETPFGPTVQERTVPQGDDRKHTYQGAVQWHANRDLTLGVTYTHSDIDAYRDGEIHNDNVNAGLVGVRWTPGNWYLAADVGEYHRLVRRSEFAGFVTDGDIAKARGIEGIALYNWDWTPPGSLQIYGGLNRLDDTHSGARNVTYIGGLAWLTFDDNVIVAMEKTVDDSKTRTGQNVGNDDLSLFLRVNF